MSRLNILIQAVQFKFQAFFLEKINIEYIRLLIQSKYHVDWIISSVLSTCHTGLKKGVMLLFNLIKNKINYLYKYGFLRGFKLQICVLGIPKQFYARSIKGFRQICYVWLTQCFTASAVSRMFKIRPWIFSFYNWILYIASSTPRFPLTWLLLYFISPLWLPDMLFIVYIMPIF